MALTLAQLVAPGSTADAQEQVLDGMEGRSIVTKTGSGSGSLAISGTPSADYAVVVKISTAGELGAAAFQVSLDGGKTYLAAVTVPASGIYALTGTGVTLAFAAGPSGAGTSFALGDLFAFSISSKGLPATAWQDGSVPKTLALIQGNALADQRALIAALARGGFVTSQPGVTGAAGAWLALAGKARYGLEPNPAVATVGTVVLTDAGGIGPLTIVPGQLWFGNTASLGGSSPLRYTNTTGGTLPQGGTLSLVVQAESPGAAYNVGNGTITTLLTSLAGVTVTNPDAGGGTWVSTQGVDAESDLAYSLRCINRWATLGNGSPSPAYDTWARTASAEVTRTKVAPGAASTNVSGSNASTTNILVASSVGFAAGNIVIASADGSYRLVTAVPDGTHVTVSPAFGAAPTTGTLSLTSGGQIDLTVAGPSGPVSAGALAAVTSDVTPKVAFPATLNVVNATATTITIAGTAYALTAYLAAAQAAGEAALAALLQSVAIGGTVYYSAVIDALQKQTGVRNLSGVTVNGGTSDVVLGANAVPVLAGSRTWSGV